MQRGSNGIKTILTKGRQSNLPQPLIDELVLQAAKIRPKKQISPKTSNERSTKNYQHGAPNNATLRRFFSTTCVRNLQETNEIKIDMENSAGIFVNDDWAKASGAATTINPGDFVEIRNRGPEIGNYLVLAATPTSFILIDSEGGTLEGRPNRVTFSAHSLISPAKATSLYQKLYGNVSSPTESVPPLSPQAVLERAEVVREITRFIIEMEEEQSVLFNKGSTNLAGIASSQGLKSLNSQSALELLGLDLELKPSNLRQRQARHFAIHLQMMRESETFLADQMRHASSGEFKVLTNKQTQNIVQIRDWFRRRSPEILGFAERVAKAKDWILTHPIKHSLEEGGLLNPVSIPNMEPWTTADRRIFEFLFEALTPNRFQEHTSLTLAPSIAKLVCDHSKHSDALQSTMNRADIMRFFAEVGVFAPWENWGIRASVPELRKWFDDDPVVDSTPEVVDGLDSVRHDFGDAAVYTIDDVSASELDDGISIEPVAGSSDMYWVHVHVADPTSILLPDSPVSRVALKRAETQYLTEGTFPMISQSFIDNAGLSLGSTQKEQRVMTISMKLSSNGEVAETKIRPGVVRNVKRLTYNAVNIKLGYTPETLKTFYNVVGLENAPVTTTKIRDTDEHTLKDDSIGELKQLSSLAYAIQKKRAETGLFWAGTSPLIKLFSTPVLSYTIPLSPVSFPTAPLVQYQVNSNHAESSSQILVSEFMILANSKVAEFCYESGISIPYAGMPKPDVPQETLDALSSKKDSQTGRISLADYFQSKVPVTGSVNSIDPKPHFLMGLDMYTRSTSPLRRYLDLVVHWQIKNFLRPSSQKDPWRTLDRRGVEEIVQKYDMTRNTRGSIGRNGALFWAVYVLRERALKICKDVNAITKEESLRISDGVLTAIPWRSANFIAARSVWTQRVMVPELGLNCELTVQSEQDSIPMGDTSQVFISSIEVSDRSRVTVIR